jgi:hypothetical protein
MTLPNSFAFENVSGYRWSLVGSVDMPAQVPPTGGSLKLTRRNDFRAMFIRRAMREGSLLPAVQITTPGGEMKLLDARVVNVAKAGLNDRPQHADEGPSEYLVISLTFRQIIWTRKGNKKGWTDDWSAGG